MDNQPTPRHAALAAGRSLNSEPDVEAQKGRFDSVFVDAAGPMLLFDDDRRLVDANRAACVLFGLTAGAVDTCVLDELVLHAGNHLDGWWREFLSLGEATCEHRVGSKGRGERIVEGRYRASVMPHRHLCLATDITDRRLLEGRLAQSGKMDGTLSPLCFGVRVIMATRRYPGRRLKCSRSTPARSTGCGPTS